jgi:DNA-directed RNA polymerase specialized sigma24 family protein
LTVAEDNALSDEELMAGIAGSDARAFEILVSRHQRHILNLIYRPIGDRTRAEDMAQEVFCGYGGRPRNTNRNQNSPPGSIASWSISASMH